MADSEGFEPSEPFGSTVFKTAAFNLSANYPKALCASERKIYRPSPYLLPSAQHSATGLSSLSLQERPVNFYPKAKASKSVQDWLLATFTQHSEVPISHVPRFSRPVTDCRLGYLNLLLVLYSLFPRYHCNGCCVTFPCTLVVKLVRRQGSSSQEASIANRTSSMRFTSTVFSTYTSLPGFRVH